MDVFELRDRVISDYGESISSFLAILDPRLAVIVDARQRNWVLWPEPRIQLDLRAGTEPSGSPASAQTASHIPRYLPAHCVRGNRRFFTD